MEKINFLIVNQLGVNDDSAVLIEVLAESGSEVKKGQVVAQLETSKAVFEVESDFDGFIEWIATVNEEVKVNQEIALVSNTVLDAQRALDIFQKQQIVDEDRLPAAFSPGVTATQKAINLAKKLNLDISKIKEFGTVRESDVQIYFDSVNRLDFNIDGLNIECPTEKSPIAIYGAGSGGLTVLETLNSGSDYWPVVFVDDYSTVEFWGGLPVVRGSDIPKLLDLGVNNIFVAISNGSLRLQLIEKCIDYGLNVPNAIHHSAYISDSVTLGIGNHIKARAVIDTNTKIGNGCIIDNNATVAHDNNIGDGCHLAPGCSLGSSINLGELVIVGIGASISTNLTVGKASLISVGTSVTKNIQDKSVVEGVPGKVIGERK